MPRIGTFVAGGVVGVIAGLLFAPRPGKETRAIVADVASEVLGDAQDWSGQVAENAQNVYQRTTAKGAQVVSGIASKSQDVLNNVQETATNVAPAIFDEKDGLRGKIEAARQRIAAQTAKNAEEDVATVDSVISTEASEVQDAVEEAVDIEEAAEAEEAADAEDAPAEA